MKSSFTLLVSYISAILAAGPPFPFLPPGVMPVFPYPGGLMLFPMEVLPVPDPSEESYDRTMEMQAQIHLKFTMDLKNNYTPAIQASDDQDIPILPRDIYCAIAENLDALSMLSFAGCCRHFNEIIHDNKKTFTHTISNPDSYADIILHSELTLVEWMCHKLPKTLSDWNMLGKTATKSKEFIKKVFNSISSRFPFDHYQGRPDSATMCYLFDSLKKITIPYAEVLVPEAISADLWSCLSAKWHYTENSDLHTFWIPSADSNIKLSEAISPLNLCILFSQGQYSQLLIPVIEANYLIPYWKDLKPMEGPEYKEVLDFFNWTHDAIGLLYPIARDICRICKILDNADDTEDNVQSMMDFFSWFSCDYDNLSDYHEDEYIDYKRILGRAKLWGFEMEPLLREMAVDVQPMGMFQQLMNMLEEVPELLPSAPATPLKIVQILANPGSAPFPCVIRNNRPIPRSWIDIEEVPIIEEIKTQEPTQTVTTDCMDNKCGKEKINPNGKRALQNENNSEVRQESKKLRMDRDGEFQQ